MKLRLISIVLISGLSMLGVLAQNGINQPSKYFGFDANPILAQIVPLSKIKANTFNASVLLRRYNKNNNGIRIGYGLGLDDNSDLSSMFLSFDYDKRYRLANHWVFFHGLGPSLKIVSQNNFNRNANVSSTFEQVLAMGGHWGCEYSFNEVVTVSTEVKLRFGVDITGNRTGAVFRLDPPINLMVHFNIFGKE